MNKIRKTAVMIGMASALALTGCGNNYQSKVNSGYSQEAKAYPTIKKTFEPGTHIVEIRFDEVFPEIDEKIGYVGVPIEIPDGYELYDVESGYWQSHSIHHLRSVYIFINTKTVEAYGDYEPKYGTYVFPKFGKIVEDKKLNLK